MEYTPNTPEQNAEYFESQDHKTWQKLAGCKELTPAIALLVSQPLSTQYELHTGFLDG